MLSIIAGLEAATSGQVCVDGTPVHKPRRDISVVFQDPVLLPWRRVVDNVLLPMEIGTSRITGAHRARAADLIDMVGLSGFEDSYPKELSGGMQQRCAIARALMLEAPLLLMDEPFGALDALTREELNLEIQDIWMQTGATVVLITHDIDEAVLLSDRIVVMSHRPGAVVDVLDVTSARPRRLGAEGDTESPRISTAIREKLRLAGPNRVRRTTVEERIHAG